MYFVALSLKFVKVLLLVANALGCVVRKKVFFNNGIFFAICDVRNRLIGVFTFCYHDLFDFILSDFSVSEDKIVRVNPSSDVQNYR